MRTREQQGQLRPRFECAGRGSYGPVATPPQATSPHPAQAGQTTKAEPTGDKLAEALAAAEQAPGLGRPGRPLDRRSPFFIGMAAAAGVGVTYGLAELLIKARSVLVLVGLALFIAAGLDPVVSWLTSRGCPDGLRF